MLDIYLPIAEVYINVPLLLLISATVGFLTGLLGIGGAFMTPILILGIPPVYAVAIVQTISLLPQCLDH